ncbi:hypothetical protein CON22_17885 [Bacillus cereus]|nr:hypothetical protein CON22_17885 [Bacillus cereus]
MKGKDKPQEVEGSDTRLLLIISMGWFLYSVISTYLMKKVENPPSWLIKIDQYILLPLCVLVITFLIVKISENRTIKNIQRVEIIRKTLIEKFEPYIFPEYEYVIRDIGEYREHNQKAKDFLATFYKELQSIPLDKKRDDYLFYEINMKVFEFKQKRIRQAFEEKRYTEVCSEMQLLIHHLPIEQPDIHSNVLKTLESYLELEAN